MTTKKITTEFRSITQHNLKEKSSDKLLGRGLPYMYDNNHGKYHSFATPIFDINDSGEFYVSYLADPTIYHYNNKYVAIDAFGVEGRDMDCDYLTAKAIDDYDTLWNNYTSKGYYTWIQYIDELGFLLRSYQKSGESEYDGLQIYKGCTLVGDIDIPKGFKPMGYIDPYLYSDYKADEINNRLKVVRIKL